MLTQVPCVAGQAADRQGNNGILKSLDRWLAGIGYEQPVDATIQFDWISPRPPPAH